MKNKTGFTLVELLAVIVILGIIVGISIPIVNTIVYNNKQKALVVMVDAAEKFVGDQLNLGKVDPDSVSSAFLNIAADLINLGEDEFLELNVSEHKELVEEMGLPSDDIATVWLQLDEDNVPCVVIASITEESKLFNADSWIKIDSGEIVASASKNEAYYSKCCSPSNVQEKYSEWLKK